MKNPHSESQARRSGGGRLSLENSDEAPGLCEGRHLRILSVIRKIPPGRVCTYGLIAAAAGLPRRGRLVGRILRDSPLADGVAWHRVVGAGGRVSQRRGTGAREQADRLLSEGIEFEDNGRIDLGIYLWEP